MEGKIKICLNFGFVEIGKVKRPFGFTLIRHASRATFPRQGGRLIGAPVETTVQSCKCQCLSLPPHGGRWLAGGQTDEGEAEGLLYVTNQRYNRKEEGP